MELNLTQKLNFLWYDFLNYVRERIKEHDIVPQVFKDLKDLSKKDLKGFNCSTSETNDCESCKDNCCSNSAFKVLLTLHDVAVLIDGGYKDAISGSYTGFSKMLNEYLNNKTISVTNSALVLMDDKLNNSYNPFIKKIKNRCYFLDKNNKCKIYKKRPLACRAYPYFIDINSKEIDWDSGCKSKGPIPDKKDIAKDVLAYENQRLRDMALIMLNSDNLKLIGFSQYLPND